MPTRAKNKLSEVNLAWAAGFIDGEGYIGITRVHYGIKQHYNYRCEIRVGHTKRMTLEILQDLFGGPINKQSDNYGGHLQWAVYTDGAANAASLLLPYLRLKRAQAELVLQFHATRTPLFRDNNHRFALLKGGLREFREKMHAQCMVLNKKRVRAERLSEEAPAKPDDAIVRSEGNENLQSCQETDSRLIQ